MTRSPRAAKDESRSSRAQIVWLTVGDVAEQLQVSERTVRNWISARALSGLKVGGVVRIHPDELDRFVRGGKTK